MSTVDSLTPLVKVGMEGKKNKYPLFLSDVRNDHPDLPGSNTAEETTLSSLGYYVVYPTDKPEGDVVAEGLPVFQDGIWQQTWTSRPFTDTEITSKLEMVKAATLGLVDQRLESGLAIGFPFTFETKDGEEIGHVQLGPEDRTNVAGCGLKADRLMAAGQTDAIMPFRVYENKTYFCTPDQIKDLSDKAYDAFLVFKKIAWDLKDAIAAAQVLADIPEVPNVIQLPNHWQSLLTLSA